MKKVLVTGGAGFVGSHLCERLLRDGNYVVCLDNLQTGSLNNINAISKERNFVFINDDVICPSHNLASYNFDEIYNLACPASPIHYQINPIQTTKTSVYGAYNMLELAVLCNAKILQASTSEVYGDPDIHPQKENYWGNVNPNGIRSCYDEGKRCAESLFFDFHRMYGLKIKVIRIFNTYGERMAINDGRVISNFITQAINNKDITIYGDGSQTRSFQYISDLINGVIKMMRSDDDVVGPINIGNPEEYTIYSIAKEIIRLTNSKSKLVFKPLPYDDPQKRRPDISLAKSKLEWQPLVRVEEGLIKTIKYFENL